MLARGLLENRGRPRLANLRCAVPLMLYVAQLALSPGPCFDSIPWRLAARQLCLLPGCGPTYLGSSLNIPAPQCPHLWGGEQRPLPAGVVVNE